MRILHLAPRQLWDQALVDGEYRGSTRGRTLADVGFVHAATSRQLPGVVARHYADVPLEDHVLLVVDTAACEAYGSLVRWEVPTGSGQAFPHVHGPVPVRAVVAVLPVSGNAGGALVLPSLEGLDVAEVAPGT